MTITWQKEWIAAPDVRDPLLARTWARFELSVDEHVVTRVADLRAEGVRPAVYGSLWPLAAWLVNHYWAILHEERRSDVLSARAAVSPAELSWMRRHNLLAAQSAGALPDVSIARAGEHVVVAWFADRRSRRDRELQFLDEGESFLPAEATEQFVRDFVERVFERVEDVHSSEAADLRVTWDAVLAADAGERRLCGRLARLGLDPYDPDEADDATVAAVSEAAAVVGPTLENDLLDAVVPSNLVRSAHAIAEAKRAIEQSAARPSAALAIASALPPPSRAYEHGYRLARCARACVLASNDPLAAPADALRAAFGLTELRPRTIDADNVRSIVGTAASGGLAVLPNATGRETPESRAFALARAVYEVVSGRVAEGPRAQMRSDWSYHQAAGRAFAAELLAPAEGLRERAGAELTEDDVERLAREYHVSPLVIRYQVANHPIARMVSDAGWE